MYIVEITEDKLDGLLEHMGRGIKCFHKAMECLEEMKEGTHYGHRMDDESRDEYPHDGNYDNRYGGDYYGDRYGHRRGGGGRYGRY